MVVNGLLRRNERTALYVGDKWCHGPPPLLSDGFTGREAIFTSCDNSNDHHSHVASCDSGDSSDSCCKSEERQRTEGINDLDNNSTEVKSLETSCRSVRTEETFWIRGEMLL